VRDNGDVSLTEAGRILKDYAHKMLKLRDDASRSITQLQNLETGTLSVAAHESAALYLLPNAILQFLQLFPDIKVRVNRARLDEIPRMVLDREVQIGFLKDAPAFQELESVDVHADRMALIASPKHPLVGSNSVAVRDLDGVPFVVHHLCSSTEEFVLRLFRQNGIRCHVVAELWSFENIKKLRSGKCRSSDCASNNGNGRVTDRLAGGNWVARVEFSSWNRDVFPSCGQSQTAFRLFDGRWRNLCVRWPLGRMERS
jgi:DNA-binding transcriptional LysR family regulator